MKPGHAEEKIPYSIRLLSKGDHLANIRETLTPLINNAYQLNWQVILINLKHYFCF